MSREMKDSGIAWIGEIPKGWECIYLKHYFSFEKGKNAALYTQEYIGENSGNFPVYSGQTENNGVMGRINHYDYDEQECLFTTTVGAKVMTPRILHGKFSLSQNCLIMKKYKEVCIHYLFYGLSALFDYEKSLIPSYMQPSLRIEDLKRYKLFLPSISEQQKIAEFLDRKCGEIDELVALQEKMIEELKAYKQSVITEAVTKGLNPNVPMKDSGIDWIGEIPVLWEICRVRNIGMTQNGISKGGEFFGEGEPFITYSDVYKNMVLPKIATGLILSTKEEQDKFSVKKGDVFFTRTSETIEEIGISSTCEETINNAVFAGFLIRLRLFSEKLLSCFAKYYFRSNIHRTYFVREMNIVTRASLSQDLLKSLIVLLPPIPEQQVIADFLDKKCAEIDELVAVKQQKIETLKEYKKSLIYEYVTGKKEVI